MVKKDAPKKTAQKGAATGSDKKRSQTVPSRSPAMKGLIVQAEGIYGEIKGGRRPSMRIPIRSLTNVSFSPRKGFFTIGSKVSKRTLSYQTVKPFAQSVRMMAFAKHLIETDDFASKREVYYTSKGSAKRGAEAGKAGWGPASFKEQDESDTIMDDIEAMVGVNREQLGFIPASRTARSRVSSL